MTPGSEAPPPTKIASGGSQPDRASGARPSQIYRPGTPRRSAFSAITGPAIRTRLQRNGPVQWIGPHPLDGDRTASSADVPEQCSRRRGECSQGRGPHFPFGDLAVMAKGLVRQPGKVSKAAGHRAPAIGSRAMTLRASKSRPAISRAAPCIWRSFGPPIRSNTCMVLSSKPRSPSRSATFPGVVPSSERTIRRTPGCKCGSSSASGRATSDTSRAVCSGQRRRVQTQDRALGAGITVISSAGNKRAKVAPTPKQNGSPLARTQTGRPRKLPIRSTSADMGDGQAIRS